MANGGYIKNEDSFDKFLDNLSNGFSREEKLGVNLAAAKQFKKIMTSDDRVPKRALKEKLHVRDGFIIVQQKNGDTAVGFTKKYNKGYIARLLNDGWTQVSPGQRGKSRGEAVEGQHFWEKTEHEAKQPVRKAMVEAAKTIIDKKGR